LQVYDISDFYGHFLLLGCSAQNEKCVLAREGYLQAGLAPLQRLRDQVWPASDVPADVDVEVRCLQSSNAHSRVYNGKINNN
jgi:hypothetical protein